MSNVTALQDFLQSLEGLGRGGDTILAHITKAEAAKLEAESGSGTFHPITGLPEFFGGDGDGDSPGEGESGASGADGPSGEDGGDAGPGGAAPGGGSPGEGESGASGAAGPSGGDSGDVGGGEEADTGGFAAAAAEAGFAPDNVDDFTSFTDDFDIDTLAQAFSDVEDTNAVASFFGFGKDLGVNEKGQVEAQTTFGFSPASLAIGLAFGLPGTLAVAAAKGLLGFEDPFAFEANFDTGSFGLANSGVPSTGNDSFGSLADNAANEGEGENTPAETPSGTRGVQVARTETGGFDLSTDFTEKIAELLGTNQAEGFIKQPDFQLLPDFNVSLVSPADRVG